MVADQGDSRRSDYDAFSRALTIHHETRSIRDPWRHGLTIRRVCPAEKSAVVKGVHTRPTRLTARLPSIAVLLALVLLSSCNGSTGSNGSSWSSASPGATYNGSRLISVVCASRSHCIAVGFSGGSASGTRTRTLIEENAGGQWTIDPSPTENNGLGSELRGVACPTTTHCIAVGSNSDSTSLQTTLIEENTGSGWTVVPSPNANAFGHQHGELTSVSCVSATHCIAVGQYESSSGFFQTLIEENTGSGWAIVPSPNSGGGDSGLNSVACSGAGRCIAVGSIGIGSEPLIEDNDARGWAIVAISGAGGLYDVTCGSPTHCVAVGFSGSPIGDEQPVILENAGGGWSTRHSAISYSSGGDPRAALISVTCASSTNCIAVGNRPSGETFMAEETGSSWTVLPGLRIGLTLNSIACVGSDYCVVVGEKGINYLAQALIVENTGKGWAELDGLSSRL